MRPRRDVQPARIQHSPMPLWKKIIRIVLTVTVCVMLLGVFLLVTTTG
ncbi:hypothetical protein JYT83_00835 [bacterium AH-315-F18]|nr:hypothetical protein [bacterium AH-315-F18]